MIRHGKLALRVACGEVPLCRSVSEAIPTANTMRLLLVFLAIAMSSSAYAAEPPTLPKKTYTSKQVGGVKIEADANLSRCI